MVFLNSMINNSKILVYYYYTFSDVAEMVLNKCTTTNSTEKDVSPDSEKYEVTFDYIFIEDRDRALE